MSSQDPQSKPSSRQLEQAGASDQSIQDVHISLLREKAEPQESFAPLPLFLLFLFSALIFVSALYLGRFSGDFSPMVYNEHAHVGSGHEGGAPAPVDPKVAGKRVFTNNCASCHQAHGNGLPGAYPALAGSEWVLGNDEVLVRILHHGLGGPVTVKGATFNGAMPSFGPMGTNLRDEQIAYVLTYIRSEWGNAAPEVTKDTVTRVRAEIADRKKAWTEAELLPLRDAKH